MPVRSVKSVRICRINGSAGEAADDYVAAEEPLEIRLAFVRDGKHQERTISITMRTPGDDFALAAGFLYSEGIVRWPEQIKSIGYSLSPGADTDRQNIVVVDLLSGDGIDFQRLERHFYTSSSCGVCGKTSVDAVVTTGSSTPIHDDLKLSADVILHLPAELRSAQAVFDQTGGLHASALFTGEGKLISLREDVGRHNALDKLIGAEFLAGHLPLKHSILLVSGRSSFELMQKAVMARIPVMAAVGAPSSLAIELATKFDVTLIGFLRDRRFNTYSSPQRIDIGTGQESVLVLK